MDGLLSLLTPEEQAMVRQQAQSQGLIGLGSALLQASAGQAGMPRPSIGQVIGQAAPAGLQAYQNTFDQTLQNIFAQQKLQDAQRQRQQQLRQQQEMEAFVSGLPEDQQARFRAFPTQAAEAMFREPKTAPGVVGEYNAAVQSGLITPGTTLEQYVAMKKPPPATTSVTNIVGGERLSPGQKKQDETFATQVVDWKMGGGQDMAAQIAQLKPVIESLEAGEPITGVSVAVQPDLLLAMTNPKALQSRELVEEVVQRNLRTILGAQFTAQEGERLIARAFNPKLPPEENAKRVRRLFLQMSTASEQKQAMSDYFDEFGTLRGYRGKMPTVQDFYNAMEGGGTMSLPAGSNLQDAARRELDRRRGQ